ncbi:MAG TPA: VOC family protein [Spirochaetia bacterium]|nr:VOC family protein [Spirochaetia bacterium]
MAETVGTKKFMQICFVVKDAEQTMKNFMDVFGIEKGTPKQIPAPENYDTFYHDKKINSKTKYYVFQMGDLTVELTQPDDTDSVWKEVFEKTGQGLCYMGIMVEDSAKAVKFLDAKGNKRIHHGGTADSNYNIVDTRDTLGFLLNVKMNRTSR